MKTNTYISLLRGINVSGRKKILMGDLKHLFEQMDFRQVTSYIQSGNVIFNSGDDHTPGELAGMIEKQIEHKFGFFVPVIVRTREEMQQTLTKNPLIQDADINRDKLHITFLDYNPDKAVLESVVKLDFSPDRFIILGKDVFIYCPEGYGGTKINNLFFEKRLKVKATTRNWKTVVKLVEITSIKKQ